MLAPFQRRFLEAARDPEVDTLVFSGPRGAGKSYLAAEVAAELLPKLSTGEEIVLAAPSLSQARIAFRFARERLGEDGYRYQDSAQRVRIVHEGTKAEIRAHGSSGKSLMGLVNTPLAIIDEPGSMDLAGGELLADSVATAQGKPGSSLRAIYCGTLAPFASKSTHWYYDLVHRPRPGKRVFLYQGDPAKWDDLRHVYAVNPLARYSPELRRQLRIERDEARRDSRLRARFMSYRLNIPSADESQVLLTVDDWERVTARPVPDRAGRPVVGVDLGGGRAWSAAVAVWESGRVEALAVAPGIPGLEDQEKRDGVPKGAYARLVGHGLHLADGLRVQPVGRMADAIRSTWGVPALIVCDRFRLAELQDARPGCPIEPRVTRWSEASDDIRGLRKMAADGPLAVPPDLRGLIAASLAVATVKNDDQGNTRLVKRGTNNTARDDVAAALCLAVGYAARHIGRPRKRPRLHVVGNA